MLQHSNLFTNEVPDCGNKRMEKKCIEIGLLDEKGYEQNNRVYSRGGVQPDCCNRKCTNQNDQEV